MYHRSTLLTFSALLFLVFLSSPSSSFISSVSASRRSHHNNPVPAGYTKPLIDTSGGAPDKESKLATLSTILNQEPAAASSSSSDDENDPNNPLFDNDIDQPQDADSKNARAKAAYQKEAAQLKNLIKQGTTIIKLLPAKQKRLADLQQKLKTLQGVSSSQTASDNLDKQQALLKSVQSKSTELTQKLNELKSTQSKLEASIAKVQSTAGGNAAQPKFRSVRNEDDLEDLMNSNDEDQENEEQNDDEQSDEESEGKTEDGLQGKDLEDALREE